MSNGREIKALLFDFDGTIIESEGPAYRSWQELYAEHGHELEMSDWALLRRGSERDHP